MKEWLSDKNRIVGALLLLLILLAFVLRTTYLDRQSIWYDEGLSIYTAHGTLSETLQRVSQSEHPPLHPLLLHIWIRLCGDSEFSVRMLSVWWSVLAVAATFRLGRRLFDRMTGLIAAASIAISPFAIWFAQETRGYALALTLIIGAVDAALDLLPRSFGIRQAPPGRRRYATFVLLATGALYTHVYSGFVLLALNLAFLLWWIVPSGPRNRRCTFNWLAAQVVVMLFLALWVPFIVAQWDANATYWHGAVYWKEIVSQTLRAFSVGKTLEGRWASGAVWSLSFLALAGVLSLCWRQRDRLALSLLGTWLLVPTLVLIVLTFNRPKFSPRYLMNVLPAFLILASAGVRWLGRLAWRHRFTWMSWLVGLVLLLPSMVAVGATARSLVNHYHVHRLYRPDMRALVDYIESQATDQDLIVLVGGYTFYALTYYYDGPSPVVAMPDELLPTTQAPIEPGMLGTINDAVVGRKQLWLVLWEPHISDPTGLVTDALEQTYHRLGVGKTFHRMALMRFDVSPGPLLVESPSFQLGTTFDEQIQLIGYDLPVRQFHPGETAYVYLYWRALADMHHDYKVFVQILDQNDRIVAQQDQIAGAAEYPTSHWKPNTMIRNRFLLTIDPTAAPQQYRLITGFYNPGRKTRLPAVGDNAYADHVLLDHLTIVRPKSE